MKISSINYNCEIKFGINCKKLQTNKDKSMLSEVKAILIDDKSQIIHPKMETNLVEYVEKYTKEIKRNIIQAIIESRHFRFNA